MLFLSGIVTHWKWAYKKMTICFKIKKLSLFTEWYIYQKVKLYKLFFLKYFIKSTLFSNIRNLCVNYIIYTYSIKLIDNSSDVKKDCQHFEAKNSLECSIHPFCSKSSPSIYINIQFDLFQRCSLRAEHKKLKKGSLGKSYRSFQELIWKLRSFSAQK